MLSRESPSTGVDSELNYVVVNTKHIMTENAPK